MTTLCSQLRSLLKLFHPMNIQPDVSVKRDTVLQMFGGMRVFAPQLEPFKLTPQKRVAKDLGSVR